MKPFTFFDHTADVKFQASGKNIQEAFANAALATTAIMTDLSKIKKKETRKIEVKANRLRSLLYDFLEELIILGDTDAFLVAEVNNLTIEEKDKAFILKATVKGDIADDYDVHTYIKSPTYSDMFIKEEKDLTTVQVVHDI